jgi:pimeloyl-ACP methyl ester carboxylesterase
MQQRFVLSAHHGGFHRIAYTEWNENHKERTVVCLHGFSRNSRDFDVLAAALQNDYRVICVDAAGHGKSDWLPHPKYYTPIQYYNDMAAVLARLEVEQVDWIGSSLGGRIGITLASFTRSPIRKLIINDVGPIFEPAQRKRIAGLLPKERSFANLDEVIAYFHKVYAEMGPVTDKDWRHMAEHSVVMGEDGLYRLCYDRNFVAGPPIKISNKTRLAQWAEISCPLYVLHGVNSSILTPDLIKVMRKLQPTMKVVDIDGVGHLPSLMSSDQVTLIKNWLAE